MLECSILKVSRWKLEHPSDTEDETLVRLSSEDEAEGLDAIPRVTRQKVRWSSCGSRVTSACCPAAEDKVLVKKRALKWMKQQVSALLQGEDLPKGTQAREVAEVPYQIPGSYQGKEGLPCVPEVLQDLPLVNGTHGCTPEVRNSHVVSVGRYLPPRGHGLSTQRLVCQVYGLDALTVVRSFHATRECANTRGPSMMLRHPPRPEEGYICPFCGKGLPNQEDLGGT